MPNSKSHPKPEQPRTTIKKEVFLEGLLEHGSISATCKALQIGRTTVYDWKAKDKSFDEAIDETLRKALMDRLFEATKSKMNPAALIFMGKAILGLSDSAGEAVQLRKQLNEAMRELEALRLAVYQSTKHDPQLQARIFEAVEKIPAKTTN